jgi:hypothetical protein
MLSIKYYFLHVYIREFAEISGQNHVLEIVKKALNCQIKKNS